MADVEDECAANFGHSQYGFGYSLDLIKGTPSKANRLRCQDRQLYAVVLASQMCGVVAILPVGIAKERLDIANGPSQRVGDRVVHLTSDQSSETLEPRGVVMRLDHHGRAPRHRAAKNQRDVPLIGGNRNWRNLTDQFSKVLAVAGDESAPAVRPA